MLMPRHGARDFANRKTYKLAGIATLAFGQLYLLAWLVTVMP